MATPLMAKIQEEVDQINARYQANFAGQPRSTRNVSDMDQLIAQTKAVLARLDGVPAAAMEPEMATIRDNMTQQLSLFETERVAIQNARQPGADQFGPLATQANFVFARYRRHFAGKSRNTRDLDLLDEMIDDLSKVEKEMLGQIAKTPSQAYRNDAETVKSNLAMYRSEREEIVKAQAAGTAEEIGSTLAALANEQFARYNAHFAGHSRVSRRPALLARMVKGLERAQKKMKEIALSNPGIEANRNNIKIVEDSLQMYRSELTEIRKAREAVAIPDLMGNLGDAANKVFEEYRVNYAGKPRTEANLDLLATLCDKLDELYRQMRDLGRAKPNEMNDKNQQIVMEQLAMFNREYDLIAQAKGITL
jgi:hypothetical protein